MKPSSITAFAKALHRSIGVAAGRRAIPIYLAFFIFAGVVLGGNGIQTKWIATWWREHMALRLVFSGIWCLGLTPAARALFAERSADYLRWLPNINVLGAGYAALYLWCLCAPFGLVIAVGGDLVGGLAATTTCAATLCTLARLPARRFEWFAFAAGVLSFVSFAQTSAWIALLVSACALPTIALTQWRFATVFSGRYWLSVFGPPAVAVLVATALGIWRKHGEVLSRGITYVALGALATALLGRQTTFSDRTLLSTMQLATAPILFSCTTLSLRLLEIDRSCRWLTVTCGQSQWGPIASLTIAASWGLLLAAGFSVMVALLTGWPLASMALMAPFGLAIGATTLGFAYRTDTQNRKSEGKALFAAILAAIVLIIAIEAFHSSVIWLALATAFAAIVLVIQRAPVMLARSDT